MKAYIAILALVLVAHVVFADWKEELVSERMKRLAVSVTEQIKVLLSAVKNRPNGAHCIGSTASEFGMAMCQAQKQFKLCVARTDDESEAKKCCDVHESTAVAKISQAHNAGLSCISKS